MRAAMDERGAHVWLDSDLAEWPAHLVFVGEVDRVAGGAGEIAMSGTADDGVTEWLFSMPATLAGAGQAVHYSSACALPREIESNDR